jgi:hypothetical protein
MRTREALREGWRDVVSGAGAAVVLAAVFAVLIGAAIGLRAAGVADDVRSAHRWVDSGAATVVVTAERRISGQACDGLTEIPSVLASGALRRVEDGVVPSSLPRTTIPTFEVSRGFPAVVRAVAEGHRAVTGAGVLLSQQVSVELGVRPGATLATDDGATTVAGSFAHPDDGRDPELAYALLEPAVDDGVAFDACWATIWPSDTAAEAAVRRTVLPATGADGEARVTTGQLNATLGVAFESSASEIGGVSARILAGVVGAVLGSFAVIRRRLTIASDRHIGVPVTAQIVGTVLQHLVWASVGAVLAVAAVLLLVRDIPATDAAAIVLDAVLGAGIGIAGAVVGGSVGHLLVRERALHRYFRTR